MDLAGTRFSFQGAGSDFERQEGHVKEISQKIAL
jgi:hypothetical protein